MDYIDHHIYIFNKHILYWKNSYDQNGISLFVDIDIIMPVCTAVFDTFKHLLRKQCLDSEILKNYRPVANLSFFKSYCYPNT